MLHTIKLGNGADMQEQNIAQSIYVTAIAEASL